MDEIIRKYGLNIKYFNDLVESVLRKYNPDEIPDLVKPAKKYIKRSSRRNRNSFRRWMFIYKKLFFSKV